MAANIPTSRGRRGAANAHRGDMAEAQVSDAYRRNGFRILARRWRCREGEIDIVAGHGSKLYFVEVKAARSLDGAAGSLSPGQARRMREAAMRYLAEHAGTLDVECRFDAALVDHAGRLRVLPGALDFVA